MREKQHLTASCAAKWNFTIAAHVGTNVSAML